MKYVVSVSKAYKHRGKHRHKASTSKFWHVYYYEYDEISEEWHLRTKQISFLLVPYYKAQQVYKRTFYCSACETKFEALVKKRAKEFGSEKSLVERILSRSEKFKEDANLKTHSWYHIVKDRTEIDNYNIPDILNMIKKLEDSI